MANANEALTVRDVARALRISRFTVYDLIKRGDLPAFRIGNRLRIESATLEAYKRAERRPTPLAGTSAPTAPLQLVSELGRIVQLDPNTLLTARATTVMATCLGAQSLVQHHYTGVLLHDLLLEHGLVQPVTTWRAGLSRYVLASGQDGHSVVVALGEIDPSYGNVPVLVAWAREGQLLGPSDGPLLLVVPSDHRGGRYVRGLTRLVVAHGAR